MREPIWEDIFDCILISFIHTTTFEETLKREYIEELNVELDECYYLGYLLVEDDNEKYAQVRMIAKIKSFNEKHIDPATGKMYGRELVSIDKVKELLNYQDKAGNLMLDEAIEMAKEKYKYRSWSKWMKIKQILTGWYLFSLTIHEAPMK